MANSEKEKETVEEGETVEAPEKQESPGKPQKEHSKGCFFNNIIEPVRIAPLVQSIIERKLNQGDSRREGRGGQF